MKFPSLLQVILFISSLFLSLSPSIWAETEQKAALPLFKVDEIHYASINSTINPATYHYLKKIDEQTQGRPQSLIMIELNTPGGLVTTTKDFLTLFGASKRPYIVWIRPEGASATSAGALISAGAHFIYMSEGSNIGAATPIQMSGDLPRQNKGIEGQKDDQKMNPPENSDLRAKAINDLVALVRSLSDVRHRNGQAFAEMITKASSFTAQEAVAKNLINGLANTRPELLRLLNGQPVRILGTDYTLDISPQAEIVEHPMDPGQRLLNIFAHPSLAYILFLIGAALIYLELQAPGGYIAGSIGAICLVLSGIGLQVLPLNFGALGLIILSFVFFVLEVFVTSFGLLSLAGFASLIFGSLFLYRTEDSYITFSTSLIVATVFAIASFLAICLYFIMRDHKNIGKEKFNSQDGKIGEVVKELDHLSDKEHNLFYYQVKMGGEFWRAQSAHKLELKQKVKVLPSSNETNEENNEMILKIVKI